MKHFLILSILIATHVSIFADGLDEWNQTANLNDSIWYVRTLNDTLTAVGTNGIYRSTDGIAWRTLPSVPRHLSPPSIAFGNGIYCAVSGSLVSVSPDLTNWTTRILGGAQHLVSATFGDGKFLILDGSGDTWSSLNGLDWTHFPPSTPGASELKHGASGFLAISPNGSTYVSTDGTNWGRATGDITGYGSSLNDAIYSTAAWVAVGQNGQIFSSHDGTFWIKLADLSQHNLARIAYGSGQFVAVGDTETVWTSLDSSNWIGRFLPKGLTLSFVIYDGVAFVGMTTGGAVYRSGRVATTNAPPQINLALYPGIQINGEAGARYDIETASTIGGNEVWKKLDSIILPTNSYLWIDQQGGNVPRRFYRAVSP